MNWDNYTCEGQMSFEDVFGQPVKIEKPIRLIELFAGVGSQAMALRNIGADFEHYRAVEYDKYAMASYNAIHGTNFETSDIRQVGGGMRSELPGQQNEARPSARERTDMPDSDNGEYP